MLLTLKSKMTAKFVEILFIYSQTADMHRYKVQRYSEIRITGAKVFKQSLTKNAIKDDDSEM